MPIRTVGAAKRGRKLIADSCEPQTCYRERIARRDADSRGCERQYACPFMARDPVRSACRKGYSNISRVKEHLRRRHVPPTPSFICPRCFTEFKGLTEQWEHFRNTIPCELSTEPPATFRDYISKETSDALNRRTKRHEGPEESWRHIYQTIYPDTLEEDIPSPFLDSLSESYLPNSYRVEHTTPAAAEVLPYQLRQSLSNTFKALDPSLQDAFAKIVQENERIIAQIVQENERIMKRREVDRNELPFPKNDINRLDFCRQSCGSDDQSTSISDCVSLSSTIATSTTSDRSTYGLPDPMLCWRNSTLHNQDLAISSDLGGSSLGSYSFDGLDNMGYHLLAPSKQCLEPEEITGVDFSSLFEDTPWDW